MSSHPLSQPTRPPFDSISNGSPRKKNKKKKKTKLLEVGDGGGVEDEWEDHSDAVEGESSSVHKFSKDPSYEDSVGLRRRTTELASPSRSTSAPPQSTSFLRPLFTVLSTLFSLFSTFLTLTSYLLPILPPLLTLLFVVASFYLALTTFLSNLSWALSFTPYPKNISLPHLDLVKAASPMVGIYCSSIGVGCGNKREKKARERKERLGLVARSASYQAVKTLDVFQSVVALTAVDGPASGLHRLELLELGAAVSYSTDLPDKEFLGSQLVALGTQTGLLRDSMRRITAKSMSTFEWVLHSFDRLERNILTATSGTGKDLSPQGKLHVELLLEELIDSLTISLSSLLKMLEAAILEADTSTELSQRLTELLWKTDSGVRRIEEEKGVWMQLVEGRGAKGKRIKRDLELSKESILAVRELRSGLDRARGSLIEYESNVENFQAGIVGFYASSQVISVEEEVESLSRIISMFRETRDEARGTKGKLKLGSGEDAGRFEEVV